MSKLDKTVLAAALACGSLLLLLIVWSRQSGLTGSLASSSAAEQAQTNAAPADRSPHIIYSAVDDNGFEQLFLLPLDLAAPDKVAGEARQITDMPQGIWDFDVSPVDGAIYFSALKEDGTGDLWRVLPDGGAPELILACADGACADPAVSPDGALVAFARRTANPFSSPMTSPPRLQLLTPVDGNAYPVFTDSQKLGLEPRWSSDGRWLSYASPDPVGVGVYQLESGEEGFFASTTGEGGVWRPGTTQVVVSDMLEIEERFETRLYLYDPATGEQIDLSAHDYPVEDNGAVWSPDGEWLALRRKELDGPGASLSKQLWRMRPDGSEATPLTSDIDPDREIDYGIPDWSPDGRYLVYHRFPLRGPNITISVWLMDVESGEQWLLA